MKDDREASDYEPLSWVDEPTARQSVEEAEQFVNAIEHYCGNR